MPNLRQLHLDRRTLLRGGAAALALPWLDAMQPALAPKPRPALRCLFVFAPNGVDRARFRPVGDGRAATFGSTLQPLEPFAARVTVFGGLAVDGARAHGDGNGDHARAAASFLTCSHPRKTGSADLWAGTSIDQHIAGVVGHTTPFASLELGLERGAAAGICDSGYSCAYSNHVSWRTPDTPVAKETDPRAVFRRLFGDPGAARDRAAAGRRREEERAVLDLVLDDAKALRRRLGSSDRHKLDQYLHAVGELHARLVQLDAEAASAEPLPPVPAALANGAAVPGVDHEALLYELLALAFATDRTRVATLMLGNGGSNRSFPQIGVPESHHDLSHHGGNAEKLDKIARIDRFHVQQFAGFLQRLAGEADGDGDLLSHCLVLYGSAIGDGNRHDHHDLPILLAGEGGGAARPGGHVRFGAETPLANLHLAIAHAMGAPLERFGDSTEPLSLG